MLGQTLIGALPANHIHGLSRTERVDTLLSRRLSREHFLRIAPLLHKRIKSGCAQPSAGPMGSANSTNTGPD